MNRLSLLLLLPLVGCAGFVRGDIPATSTPAREARYLQSHDAANAAAGFVADQALRFVFKGPTDHFGRMQIQIPGTRIAGGIAPFRWTSGSVSPYLRLGTVMVLGGLERRFDRGYRESGWLVNVSAAVVNEWLHYMIGAIRGHL